MNFEVIAVGHLRETYFSAAVEEYTKRLRAYGRICIRETPQAYLPADPSPGDICRALEKEADAIFPLLAGRAYRIALCVEGKQLSSEALSQKLEQLATNGTDTVSFLIGSSYGLCERVKAACDFKLSFSKMTFPHTLMRVLLTEQLYRACNLIGGGKYHK